MPTSLRQKELIRGKALYYLHLIYPQQATMQLLQAELDYFGYPIPIEELSFHIAYLADKKLVEIETVRGPYSHRSVNLVKITARGIDLLDGRLSADEGIYLEPPKTQ
jgi:hypothetical protein